MLKSFTSALLTLALVLSHSRADIVINEVVHAASDRVLKWSAPHPTGIPRLGTGPAFYESSYDDSAARGWRTGNAPFGFGNTTDSVTPFAANTLTYGTNTQTQMLYLTPTLYLRKTITVSALDAAKTDPLELVADFNDGFIIYVNGVEIARRWAGPAGQFQFHNQHAYDQDLANTTADNYKYNETVNLGPANTRLVAGTNVIAVHALNQSYINPTFVFGGTLRIGGASPVTLITSTDAWKYFPGVVEPAGGLYDPALLFAGRLSVPWGKLAYQDTAWTMGTGPHGQGIAGLGTAVTGVVGVTPSLYTRIIFYADAVQAADVTPLQLLMDYDDSFVAYINGVEVARANQGLANTVVPRNAVATAVRNYGTTTTYTIDPAKNVLVEGANVLAIQTHNVSVGEADIAVKADLRIGAAGAMLVVNNAATWRYFKGTTEPVLDLDGAVEDNPDAPESVNDWVELHNNGVIPVSLNGWALTDDFGTPMKWLFPNVSIPPGGYLVVILDGQDVKTPGVNGYLHADFKLDADGEFLALFNAVSVLVQQFSPLPKGSPHHSVIRNAGGVYVYSDLATPGAANGGTEFTAMAATPVPSAAGGFYGVGPSVTLTTTTPGATIRYTDTASFSEGVIPTSATGTLYSGAIAIASSRSIRAVAFAPGMLPSPPMTHTYLINEPAPRPTLPAVTLVGEQSRSLYRPYGVMAIQNNVTGAGGNFVAGPWSALGDPQQYNNANFRGIWGERPVTWQYLAANGSSLFNFDIGLRMAGSPFTRPRYILAGPNGATPNTTAWSTTDALNKPSMNFYMRDDLGGDPLDFPIIPNSPVTKHSDFRFRGGHNDTNPFIVDELARRLFIDTGNKGSLGVNTTLYINAQFKGIFNLVQHLRQEWMREAFNSDLDWDVVQVAVPADGDGIAYQEMFTFLRNNPQGTLANYQGMQARLDMPEFVDYLIQNIYTCTGDWPHNNWVASRERSNTGKWRFFTWDAEGAFASFGLTVTSNNFVVTPQNNGTPGVQSSLISTAPATEATSAGARILYTLLRDSPEFKLLFADRIQKHFFNGGALTDAAILARNTALVNECQPFTAGFNAARIPNWVNGIGDTTRWTFVQGGTAPNFTVGTTTNAPSRRRVLLDGFTNDLAHHYLPAGFVNGYFKTEGLFPATLAPVFSQHGGAITPPFNLTITNPNGGGSIYYTVDGLDPRLPGGAAQGSLYTGPITLSATTVVKARVFSAGGEWSPLQEATFSTTTVAPILITEIMYNPPDYTVSPGNVIPGSEAEFLEIKNVSSSPVSLNGMRFRSGVDFTFPAGVSLPAGGHGVIAKNADQFAVKYPGVPVLGQYGPSTALANGGDTLIIEDAAKNVVFSVTFDDAPPWPIAADGGGRSLVPVLPNSNTTPNVSGSWRASTNINGSPGADDAPSGIVAVLINEVLANSDAPLTDSIEIYNPSTTETASIGNWWLSDDLGTPQKYRIPAGITIAPGGYLVFNESQFNVGSTAFALSSNGDEVVLSSGNPAGEITGYTVYAQFGASEAGVTMARHTNTEVPARTFIVAQKAATLGAVNSGPKVGPLVFTKVHYHPSGTASEFLEIKNISNSSVALFAPANPNNTWRIQGVDFSFPAGVTVQPRKSIVVSAVDPVVFRATYSVPATIDIYGPFAPAELQNTGERVSLQKPGTPYLNGFGQTVVPYIDVDFLTYTNVAPWLTTVSGSGKSLERSKLNDFGDDKNAWKATTSNIGVGSIGRPSNVTFSNWQSQWFTAAESAISGIAFDADGDGMSNGMEYAFSRNPRAADSSDVLSSAMEMDGAAGPFLTLSFRKSLSIQSTAFTPEVTATLGGTWLSGGGNTLQIGTATNNGDGSETLKYRDTVPISSATQRNMRLKVTLP